MTRRHPSQRGGFTLIELLVAVGVLMLLASITLPAFDSARAKSRQVECLASLRHIHTAMMLYAGEHGDQLPPSVSLPSTTFMELLEPYGMEDARWRCPDGESSPATLDTANGKHLEYGYNDYGRGAFVDADGDTQDDDFYDSFDPASPAGVHAVPRTHSVANPSVIFIADSEASQSPQTVGDASRGTLEWPLRTSFDVSAFSRHRGQYNAISLEGSAQGYDSTLANNTDWFIQRKD